MEWDAAVLTALLGTDRMVNDRLLAGAALAWSSSSFDYQTNGSGGDLVEGKRGQHRALHHQPLHGLAVLTAARACGPVWVMDGVISPLTMRTMQQPPLT